MKKMTDKEFKKVIKQVHKMADPFKGKHITKKQANHLITSFELFACSIKSSLPS